MLSKRPAPHKNPQSKTPDSKNPGVDLLTSEDWVAISEQLNLTARELSVAILIFEGKSRYQIARKLGCATGTVRVYIDRVYHKLHVHDRLGMVLRIVRLHLGRTQ